MSTLRVTNLVQASSGTNNIVLDDKGNATVANTLVMGSSFKRNKIINGDMRVDQRATAATANGVYSVDRWQFSKNNDATESVTQNSDAPTGFSYSLRNTISVADASIGAGQYSSFIQTIEGNNVADLSFGSASAKTITISFWVKATQAGTYSCSIYNHDATRCCWKSFTVNNTSGVGWEYKTLTFNGDTSGTWLTTNDAGLNVRFFFALGTTFQGGSDGVWTSSVYLGPSGMTNGIGTNGNICAITGVQLEVGSIATPYERQIYSEQLAQCQRYYYKMLAGTSAAALANGFADSTTTVQALTTFPVQMRVAPSALEQSGTASDYRVRSTGTNSTTCSSVPTFGGGEVFGARSVFTVASGLTGGQALLGYSNTTNAYLAWSAEL